MIDALNKTIDNQTQSQIQSQTQTQSQSQTQSETQTQTQSQSETQSQTQTGGSLSTTDTLNIVRNMQIMMIIHALNSEILTNYLNQVFIKSGIIHVKKTNRRNADDEEFDMTGGGLFSKFTNKKEGVPDSGTVTTPFPSFLKPTKDTKAPIVIEKSKKKDFETGVYTVLDKDVADMFVAFNKKFGIKDVTQPIETEPMNLKDIYFDKVIKDNNTLLELLSSQDKSSLDNASKAIKELRPTLTTLLKEANYDASRVTNQVKMHPLNLLASTNTQQISANTSSVPPTSPEVPEVSKVIASKEDGEIYTDAYPLKTNIEQNVLKSEFVPTPIKQSVVFIDPKKPIVQTVPATPVMPVVSSRKLPNITPLMTNVSENLSDIEEFYKKLQRKQAKWIDEINAMLVQGQISLQQQIQSKVDMLNGGKLLEIERRKVSIQLHYLLKKILTVIREKSIVNYAVIKDYFFRDKRQEVKNVIDFISQYMFIKDNAFPIMFVNDEATKSEAIQLQKSYISIETAFMALVEALHQANVSFYDTLAALADSSVSDVFTINMRDKERANILNKKKELHDEMSILPKKIKYFYTLNYPLTEMFDMQFVIMYIVKAVRIASYQLSMNMATNVFLQKYESTVYDKKTVPPSLVNYMMIFFGFDLFFNTFLLVLLGLAGFLFKTENNTFPIDKYLFFKFGFDYIVTTVAIMVIGIMIGSVIKQKKYFRYKTEGERGIRAFEDIMKSTATVITLLPVFMIIS
jgi:hypothetical protein